MRQASQYSENPEPAHNLAGRRPSRHPAALIWAATLMLVMATNPTGTGFAYDDGRPAQQPAHADQSQGDPAPGERFAFTGTFRFGPPTVAIKTDARAPLSLHVPPRVLVVPDRHRTPPMAGADTISVVERRTTAIVTTGAISAPDATAEKDRTTRDAKPQQGGARLKIRTAVPSLTLAGKVAGLAQGAANPETRGTRSAELAPSASMLGGPIPNAGRQPPHRSNNAIGRAQVHSTTRSTGAASPFAREVTWHVRAWYNGSQ
ncbi:MAG TPA: hypothetical protein VMX97_13525 [Hyphomicrobiaceae bacterium]|nr:hypothetical protein [Hyphomicrobiaceae bacterium]